MTIAPFALHEQIPVINRNLAVVLTNAQGEILYENLIARQLLGHVESQSAALPEYFVADYTWAELLEKIRNGGALEDETVVLHTAFSDADLCYLNAFPFFNEEQDIEAVLCLWSARRGAVQHHADSNDENNAIQDYIRELEGLLEHRTFQRMLAAEKNEFAAEALESLPVGIIVADIYGHIVFRNRAMEDIYGLRLAEFIQPHLQKILNPDLWTLFCHVAESGLRRAQATVDPGGLPAIAELLPLAKNGHVEKVVVQFCRGDQEHEHS
jgi:transcriptional regulator with PAS, ATPase and Fis domain